MSRAKSTISDLYEFRHALVYVYKLVNKMHLEESNFY